MSHITALVAASRTMRLIAFLFGFTLLQPGMVIASTPAQPDQGDLLTSYHKLLEEQSKILADYREALSAWKTHEQQEHEGDPLDEVSNIRDALYTWAWQAPLLQLGILLATVLGLVALAGWSGYVFLLKRLSETINERAKMHAEHAARATSSRLLNNVGYEMWRLSDAIGTETPQGRAHVNLAIDLTEDAIAEAEKLPDDDPFKQRYHTANRQTLAWHLATRIWVYAQADLQLPTRDGDAARALQLSREAYEQREAYPPYRVSWTRTFIYVRKKLLESGVVISQEERKAAQEALATLREGAKQEQASLEALAIND